MARILPAAVKARLAASGGGAAVSLLEVLTFDQNFFAWADCDITAAGMLPVPSVIAGHTSLNTLISTYQPWLMSCGPFKIYGNTTTSTGQVVVQNLSGDTVRRDVSRIFSKHAMMGALVCYRRWLADCQYAEFSFVGSVSDVDVEADGEGMTLQIESLAAWSRLDAPYQEIGVSCPLAFGSIECGSTSSTPCNNSYGSCSSTERYKGILVEWLGASLSTTQYVLPAPLIQTNQRVAG